jgi:hypothetical protein
MARDVDERIHQVIPNGREQAGEFRGGSIP